MLVNQLPATLLLPFNIFVPFAGLRHSTQHKAKQNVRLTQYFDTAL